MELSRLIIDFPKLSIGNIYVNFETHQEQIEDGSNRVKQNLGGYE